MRFIRSCRHSLQIKMMFESFNSSGTCQLAALSTWPSSNRSSSATLHHLSSLSSSYIWQLHYFVCISANGSSVNLRSPLSNTAPNVYRTTQRLKINTKGSPLQRRGMQQLLWEKRKCVVRAGRLGRHLGLMPDQETSRVPTSSHFRKHSEWPLVAFSIHLSISLLSCTGTGCT